ncbi:class IIb bacteriocin, lactobin A/cerein 7B family [Pseudoalteromonas sp. MMG024]|uniref:class IIb bacteriocin, lactobin A/cerein 7B family n=1 Tax=Pseudoalteromonas sp. MMG024 TaxID=2909980 RepID=UPI001F1EA715|nr:class IIb bacteriocin, lactobin A/cerein 7B family [Pseudoalteromonas sp. MMG024]MCF6457645.1 class IIb bacteriocin, lactobin A/cerein 7B family [Pseudoalteromonas sp. MMG024]
MKELTINELKQVHGGILPAFLAGAALGALAKKLYNKYQESQPAQVPCANDPNCA